jgi:hypothetical protein
MGRETSWNVELVDGRDGGFSYANSVPVDGRETVRSKRKTPVPPEKDRRFGKWGTLSGGCRVAGWFLN